MSRRARCWMPSSRSMTGRAALGDDGRRADAGARSARPCTRAAASSPPAPRAICASPICCCRPWRCLEPPLAAALRDAAPLVPLAAESRTTPPPTWARLSWRATAMSSSPDRRRRCSTRRRFGSGFWCWGRPALSAARAPGGGDLSSADDGRPLAARRRGLAAGAGGLGHPSSADRSARDRGGRNPPCWRSIAGVAIR